MENPADNVPQVINLTLDPRPIIQEQDRDSTALLELAQAYGQIDTPEVYEIARTDLADMKTKRKKLEESRLTITRPLDQAKKAVMELFNPALTRLDSAISIVTTGCNAYLDEVERKRKAEEARIAEEQRLERERLEREAAERQRVADEEAAARIREAEAAQARGDNAAADAAVQEAEQIQQQASADVAALHTTAAVTAAPIALTTAPKVKGASEAGVWKAEVADKMALIRFVAANPQYEALLDVNEAKANAQAKSLEAKLDEAIPGLRAVWQRQLRDRRRA